LGLSGDGISSGGALRNLSGANSYAGAITLGAATRINSDSGNLTLSGGISGTQNLSIGGAGNTTVSGTLATGTGTLAKDGLGTLVLSANNTYTGETLVTAGTLIVNGHQSSASGAVSVAAGATLGGTGTLGGATTVSGILAPGTSIGVLNVAANTTWVGALLAGDGTDWKFELGSGNTADQLNITGNFLKNATAGTVFRFDFLGSVQTGTFKLVDWSGMTDFSSGDFTYTGLDEGSTGNFVLNGSQLELQVAAIPEPSTWALGIASLLVFLVLWARKKTSIPAQASTPRRGV
jgi:autotransporter-associated beta strand protein